jgi:hypothetical protein
MGMMTSINKFKDIVEIKMRILNFRLKLITLVRLVTCFDG